MRYAVIENGVVTNITVATAEFAAQIGWHDLPNASIGDRWDGSDLEPAPAAPTVVPHSVTRFQAKAALDEAGHLDAIEAIIANPDTPRLYVLAWQDALSFERDSQTLAALAGMLQLGDADLDALFIRAAEIKS